MGVAGVSAPCSGLDNEMGLPQEEQNFAPFFMTAPQLGQAMVSVSEMADALGIAVPQKIQNEALSGTSAPQCGHFCTPLT